MKLDEAIEKYKEITKEYREAKDKGNQIRILADEKLTDRKKLSKS